jgi:tetratricopeptide (TPR) repeat protein
MKFAKAAMLLITVISASSTADAGTPIRLARERFANSKAIKLDLESQEQLNKGDVENAQRSVNLALQEDPELWLTYFMRARIFMRQHKYELTIQDCNWVLRKYPKFIEAALLRVEANAELGKYAASLNELDYVVRIRPNLESYARALGNARGFDRAVLMHHFETGIKRSRMRNWRASSRTGRMLVQLTG